LLGRNAPGSKYIELCNPYGLLRINIIIAYNNNC
jgi:hypothetical protein